MCAPLPAAIFPRPYPGSAGAATRYEYDAEGRATREIFADGSEYHFAYSLAGNRVMETRIVNPRGQTQTWINGVGLD